MTLNNKYFWKDRLFIKTMLAVALPVAVQFLISTSINMADTVMISSLGSAEIAAVGLVNQFVFFFMVATFGFCSAGAVFFSQFYGDRNMEEVRRYLSITLQLVTILSLIFTVISLIWSKEIMRLLIPDEEVIFYGAGYLRLIALTFVMTGISQALNTVLRSVNRAFEPLLVSIVAFFTNVFFNYIFIFGKLGAPALGVRGAAVGTIIARFVEIVLLLAFVFFRRPNDHTIKPIEIFAFHKEILRKFFKIALPIIIAEVFWSLGQLMFSVAYARIGKDATAAVQLTNTIQNLFFILVNAINTAAAVLIGQSLGANDKDYAKTQASYFISITLMFGLVSTAFLSLLPDLLLKIYNNLDPAIYQMARNLLIIRGLFIAFRFLNGMLFVGIFRAGGETKLPLIFELLTMWVFAIPASFIGVLLFKLPVELIFTIVSTEELIKFILIFPLYKKNRWLKTITH
ncbi:MAG: MATE family efflux transporter [Tissierellia bacterium]|nr:MATE family efflux transporter [Tissierellia bacterium]